MLQNFNENYNWEDEKIEVKSLIFFKNDNEKALDYIESLLPLVLQNKNQDIIYYFLFNKALCFYKLNRIDECLDMLHEAKEYAESLHEKMKLDWSYGLCYELADEILACRYYDSAINNCENRLIPDKISSGQIKCTKAMLLNNIVLMENAVQQIVEQNPLEDVLDIAYKSLCSIYINNNLYFKAYSVLKNIKNTELKLLLRSKILI